ANVAAGTRRIQARRIGFVSATQSVNVISGQPTSSDFALVVSPIQLEEIKTVGFGTQEARTVTGAVATVSSEKIKDIPTSDPMKAIQGRVPGVEVVAGNNEPGTAMQVRIRGVRSLQASNEPLYVVDGIPISGGIQDFNPAIIESVDVLKDAAATAIYGSRGANGVILVTTKKGTLDGRNHSSYTLDSYYGAQSAVRTLNMMNMQQYVQMLRDGAAYANGSFNGDTSIAKILAGQSFVNGVPKKLFAYNNGIETDWFKTVLQDAQQKSFQGNLTGNTPDTRYTLSGNWFDQGGLIPGQGYRRGSGFASINHTKGRLNVGLSANSARIYQDIGEGGGAFGYTAAMAPFGSPFNYTNPDSAGLYDPRPDDDQLNINPLLENRSFVRQRTTNRIFGSAYAQLQLMEGLSFRTNFGPDFTNVGEGCYNDPWTHGPCANPGANSQNQGAPPQAFFRNAYDFAYTLDNLLQLSRDIGSKQHLEATALYSIQHDRANRDSIYASNLPYNTQLWYDLGSGTAGQQLSNVSEWALRSYMGRINYTLLDRYTMSFTGRSDGSSRLAPGHKWAFFPSFGLSWQVGDEAFMKRFTALNSLKLRGSYGTTGNTSINPYATQGLLTPRIYSFGNTAVRGYRPGSIPNPDLSWEKTDQTDVGTEFAMFNNRFSGSLDWYRANTHDLLLPQALPVSSGFTQTLQNVGSTQNTGVEVSFSTVNVENWHGMTWSSDVNWSRQRNKITALQSGTTQNLLNTWFVGSPINLNDGQHAVFFDYTSQGVWQYADTVLMKQFNSTGSTFKVGQPRVADLNGDGKIDVNDRSILGTQYPSWTGSFSNRVSYKGWDLSGLITAKWKYTFIDGTPRGMNGRNGNIVMDYWTPTNPTNANAAPQVPNSGGSWQYQNTLLYRDGSHWRIRNITLGYTAGERLAGRIGAGSLRLYATAQDPYIHTDYPGTDPEVGGSAPTIRTLLIGTNINW
ncbi:MAG: TonB-dependent outer membrane protein SusC/RagA, partial [Gemmatimonadetes bacterium]|nr:TonB-dependent outer membrane protein SusC/RagA [Gemmatimonadota bacterium]